MPDPQQHGLSTPLGTRGLELFRALGRRLARQDKKRSSDENPSASIKESSKDSISENSENSEIQQRLGECSENMQIKKKVCLNLTDSSDTSSERTSDSDSVAILSTVLRRLSLRSSPSSKKRKPKPKSILRRPVCHAHVRGISGLPTQRVPVSRGYYRYPHVQSQYQG